MEAWFFIDDQISIDNGKLVWRHGSEYGSLRDFRQRIANNFANIISMLMKIPMEP